MSRKNTYILYGGLILLVVSGVLFHHYQNSKVKEPIRIYKTTVPNQQGGIEKKTPEVPEVSPLTENDTWEDSDPEAPQMPEPEPETETSTEEFQNGTEDFTGGAEPLPITQADEPQQEDPRVVMLEAVFPEIDRNLREALDLKDDIAKAGASGDFAEFEARGKALESELQEYSRQIADKFPEAVTFVTLQGQEWVYDIDFEILQNSIVGAVSPELAVYFQYTTLREMFGLPDIPPDQLQQLQ